MSSKKLVMARQLQPSPQAKSPVVTKVMKANKAKETKPELRVRSYLWKQGFRGYRLNWKGAPGRPDICFTKHKIAIFVHGCFWHRCPNCFKSFPKSNTDFWRRKFELNVARDEEKIQALQVKGWKVLVIWECDIKKADYSSLTQLKDSIQKGL
jgi:DNA mismatch endonuclease (patch repair protein)